MSKEFEHTSVLLREAVEALNIKPDGIYVDGTLGGGGHSYEIRSRLHNGRLIGIDRDEEAIEAAGRRLSEFENGVDIVRDNYQNIPEILEGLGIFKVDGILLDLGVSSHQLDDEARGFSYRAEDSLLDMRMDNRDELTARTIINEWPREELIRIIRDFGEERYAREIAYNIVKERERGSIDTAGELNRIIERSVPHKSRKTGGVPMKRTYQALRIATNNELGILDGSLDTLIKLLAPGGRFAVITFHSLEDRIVKNHFRTSESPCICPPDFPVCVCGRKSEGRVVTKHPILPGEDEIKTNPRSKSAKLRVFERAGGGGK